MKKQVLIIDSTLRDGSHAIKHQLTRPIIEHYSKAAENAHIPVIVVGHGNGLGASSLQLGRSLLGDLEMLSLAKKNLVKTRLGAFFIPGFGTIKNDLLPAISLGIDVLMIASHCTEANITREHIEFAKNRKVKVYGVLMMSHMASEKELLKQAGLMQSYGADGVILMDSAGASLPSEVGKKIKILTRNLNIEVGFHAHNNLGLSIANSIAAVEQGAGIIDGTTRGFGAGAGNCQLEVIIAVFNKLGVKTGVDLFKLMDASEQIISKIMPKLQEISSIELTSGLAGVFSGFAPHAKRAAKNFGVDVREIILELGRRKAVAGQEDYIVDIAYSLRKNAH